MDIHGHHGAVCSVSGDRVKRHDALRNCFHKFCFNEAWGLVKEKSFLLPFSLESSADIFVLNFSGGKGLVVNLPDTCLIQQNKYTLLFKFCLLLAINMPRKYDIHESRGKYEGHLYLPIVFESFGARQMMQLNK